MEKANAERFKENLKRMAKSRKADKLIKKIAINPVRKNNKIFRGTKQMMSKTSRSNIGEESRFISRTKKGKNHEQRSRQ